MIKALSTLLFVVLAARIAFAQTCNCNTVGSTTGHGYFYIHGNTNANSSSIFRLTKWQNSNAHLDVMDGKDLHLNYYAGNHVYFGTGTGSSHSVFTKDGKLGVGTRNPDQRLTVNGNVNIGGQNNGTLRVRHVTGKNPTNEEYGDLFLNYHTSKPVYIGTTVNKAPLYIHGNIGVGTTATNARVDIKASSSNQNVFRISHPTAPAAAGLIVGFGTDGNGQNDSSIDFKVDFSSTTYNVLGIDRTSRDFYYNGEGNVGIGTTNPTEKLAVNGTIRSKEVLVEASPWPDFVFTKDHKLLSLYDIADFIDKHGHLPQIPSAQEVEKEGIALAKMNARLLEKIEELTLYTIQQQRQLDAQKELIDGLLNERK